MKIKKELIGAIIAIMVAVIAMLLGNNENIHITFGDNLAGGKFTIGVSNKEDEESKDVTSNLKEENKSQLYEVVRVVDGDTIVVKYNGVDEKVRLIGIDTPESVHADESKNTEEGVLVSDYTKKMLTDKKVGLEFDVSKRDKYGRLLAYVYLDGEMYNKILLKEGYARVATYPPNVKYVDEFVKLQKEARENNKGLWQE
jgi:micrococcal nuclease